MQSTVAESGATTGSSAKKSWHPKGLFVLSSTEMWERFNFYGMRALLTLFLVNALQFSEADSSIIYGGYLGLCYLTPMLGGYVADRFLGNRNCIMLGGFVLALGQFFMFLSGANYTNLETAKLFMYVGLGVQILANGFFKPNISSMVGQLYPKADTRLDSAFTIFYMGINVGSLLGMAICPVLGDVHHGEVRVNEAFKWGFLAAGLAVLLGTVIFYFLKNKYVVDPSGNAVGTKPKFTNQATTVDGEAEKAHFATPAIIGCLALMGVLFYGIHILSLSEDHNAIKEWVYPFIYAAGITLAVLILTDKSITRVERDRILVMYVVAFFVIFFWSCFEQAGSSLTFIADYQTDTHLFGYRLPPSSLQNANSVFIIVLALPFSFLWSWLQKRRMEPISLVKQSIGLFMLAVGFYIIAQQVKNLGDGKIGIMWMFIMYFFHTVGELCLSPIGLSLVSKLAPKRFTSLLMGVWFLANAAGYALAGTLGALLPPDPGKYKTAAKAGIDLQAILDKSTPLTESIKASLKEMKIMDHYPTFAGYTIHNLYEFFMVFVILPLVAAGLLFLLSFPLKRMMHGVK